MKDKKSNGSGRTPYARLWTQFAFVGLVCLAQQAAAVGFGPAVAIQPDDVQPGDSFGLSVATDGTLVVAGSPQHDANGIDAGAAYIFDANTGDQLTKLVAPDASAGAWFGKAVGTDNGKVVVSAYNASKAYVFGNDGGFLRALTPPGGATGSDFFGTSLAVEGNRALIGAPFYSNGLGPIGAAFLFDLDSGALLQTYTPPASSGFIPFFGESVDLKNGKAIVGAPFAMNANGSGKGSAYLFNQNSPSIVHEFISSVAPDRASFGSSVALGVDFAAVRGTDNSKLPAETDTEHVILYDTQTGQQVDVIAQDSLFLGTGQSIDIDGIEILVANNISFDQDNQVEDGKGLVYTKASSLDPEILAPTGANKSGFGQAVALNGGVAVIGAPANSTTAVNAGRAYIFTPGTLPTPGDTDGDGDIDDADLGTAFSNYTGPLGPGVGEKSAAEGDTDGDGDVDDADLGTAFANYTGPLGAANVPEPASVVLLAVGAAFGLRRRKN
jgi:hypothetical protein